MKNVLINTPRHQNDDPDVNNRKQHHHERNGGQSEFVEKRDWFGRRLPNKSPFSCRSMIVVRHALTIHLSLQAIAAWCHCRREFLPGFRERLVVRFGCWQRALHSLPLKSQSNREQPHAAR